MSELSQAEWTVLEAAIEDGAIADTNPDRALVQGAERGWLAARDYYSSTITKSAKKEIAAAALLVLQAEERERALEDALKRAVERLDRVRLGLVNKDDSAWSASYVPEGIRALASPGQPAEQSDDDQCVCGHTRHWHGAGEWTCEAGGPDHPDGDCPCSTFESQPDHGPGEPSEDRIIDLGGPDGGRYWRVVSDHTVDHPDARRAAVMARATGSLGCTYNDAGVQRVQVGESNG